MEDRKELSEILLGNNKQSSSSGKKAVVVVIIAILVIVGIAFAMWKFLGSKEEKIAKPSEMVDSSTMKPLEADNFGNDFVGFNFDQPNNQNPSNPNPTNNDFSTMGQNNIDFNTLGFGQEEPNTPTTDIDDALNNITNSIDDKEKEKSPAQEPKAPIKDTKKDDKKPVQASKPQTESKPESKPKTEPKVASKPEPKKPQTQPKPESNNPTNTPSSNGSIPTKGFYWQIGSFEKEPNSEFLALIKKYPYRIQHTKKDTIPTTRYLLGPYKSKNEAPNKDEIANIFKENPTPVEIQ